MNSLSRLPWQMNDYVAKTPENHKFFWRSVFGWLEISWTDTSLVSLQRKEPKGNMVYEPLHGIGKRVVEQVSEYFTGKRQQFDLPLALHGTPFQKKVWQVLCAIPYGETRCYQEIAQAIGNPKAVRAVGMANHRNPIAIIVPCHRVIGKNGTLVGYGGGLDMKAGLLKLERAIRAGVW